MNDPIISPWLIYLIMNIGSIKGIFIASAIVFAVYSIFKAVCRCDGAFETGLKWRLKEIATEENPHFSYFQEIITKMDRPDFKKATKNLAGLRPRLTVFIVLLLFCIGFLIPGQKTLIAMVAADNITPNSVGVAKDVAGDFKDVIKKDVLDIINEINKEDSDE